MKNEIRKKAEEIANYLKEKYGVKTIFLCGSRAVGDYYFDSDWDMFALSDKVVEDKSLNDELGYPEIPGEYLQVIFLPVTQKFDWNVFGLKLRFSELILDTDGIGAKIMEDAMKIYNKGPDKWTKEYALSRILKAEGYITKIKRLWKNGKKGHAFAYICYHYTENIIPWWFAIRGEWQSRPQQTFDYIKEIDPKFYKQLERIFSNTSNEEKIEAIKKIHKLFFESKEFKELIQ